MPDRDVAARATTLPARARPRVITPGYLGVLCGVVFCLLAARWEDAKAAPLPVETFFKKWQYGGAVLSPSGRYLGVITTRNGRHNASVLDLDARKADLVTGFDNSDAIRIVWQTDDRLLVIIGDLQRGTGEPPRAWGIVAVDRDGGRPRLVTDTSHLFTAGLVRTSFERPWTVNLLRVTPGTNEILLTARERNINSLDLYRYDTLSGAKTLLSYESPGNVGTWVVDFDHVPRAAVVDDLDHDISALYVRKRADQAWQMVEQAGLGRLNSTPLAFTPDGKILYVDSRKGGDRSAIYEYELESGKWTGPVVSHPERDISATFVIGAEQRKLLGLRYVDDKPSSVWFDAEWANMQKSVDTALPDTVNSLQREADRWIVVATSDCNPGAVYLLDAKSRKMEKLYAYAPWIEPAEMATTRWVRYAARDGLKIPALLTLPKNAEGQRVPLVVDIHGGPYVPAQNWGYNSEVQFLASRGYAVLQPQFRGTDGFGWKLFAAGFRKWGDEMQDDLEDGVKWAVAQGLADPDRVCFFGASYGGYAAMWGAIKNANLIKCAVAYVGVSSIDYMFDNAQTDMSQFVEKSSWAAERIGDPKTERARFKRVNPLDHADQVGVPILLAYGASDLRVPLVHGVDFRAALDKYHKSYEWVVYENEGHGFNRDENLFDFYGRVERFLARYLSASPAPAR